jgi:hypothetical protein
MFHFEGARTDKHVREHEVYAIGYPGDFTGTQRKYHLRSKSKTTRYFSEIGFKIKTYWKVSRTWCNEFAAHWREVFDQASNDKKALYIGLVTLPVLLLVLLLIRLAFLDDAPKDDLPKIVAETSLPFPAAASGVSAAQTARAAKLGVAKPAVAKPASEVQEAKSGAVVKPGEIAKPSDVANTNKVDTKELAKKESESFKVVQTPAISRANVILKIKPWGEVYVDGNMVGVSPPLIKLQLSLGEHVIEVRNTKFPVSTRVISLNAGMKVTVKHTFGN